MDSKLPLWTADGDLSHGVTDYTPSQAEANNDLSSQCEIVINEGSSMERGNFSNVFPQSIHCKEPLARIQGIVPEDESSLSSSSTYTNYASMAPDCQEIPSGTTFKPRKYSNFSICQHPGTENLRLVPKDYLERIDSMTSNMFNSVNDQAATAQQQTDGQYLDLLFDDSSVIEKKISDTSCNILLSVDAQTFCKVVRKEENRGAYDTTTCSQRYSSCELSSSDTKNTSTITNTDTATNNSQGIAQKSIGKAHDTTAHYNFLEKSQSLPISPNSEVGITGVFSVESTSKARKSENISSQTPTDSLEKETAYLKPYKDHLIHLSAREHKIDPNIKPSFDNHRNVSTPVTMKNRVWHSYKKRKLLKMAKALSAIQEPTKNRTAHSEQFSTDTKKIKTKAGKKLLHNRREDKCCKKSGTVKHPAPVTDNRQTQCVKTSKMFGPHTNVSTGTEPNNSQEGSSKLLGGFKKPLKAAMSETHDNMPQSSAKALQSNSNALLKTPFTEKAPNTVLNGDAAFELSMQSTINNTGLHFCIANAFNKRVKDERSGNPFMGLSVNAYDDHPGEFSEMDIGIKNSNAISAKHSPIQKVDGFTQYYDEDCVTKLNKDTYTVADAAKITKKAKRYINCKYCRRTFRHISAYTAHQRIHTGEKPYRCELCGKNFAQLSKLRSHRNVHVQSMSWPCPCCRKKFSNKKDLVVHFSSHVNGSKQNTEPDQQDSKSNIPLRDPTPSKGIIFNIYNQFNNGCDRKIKHHLDKLISCTTCGKEFWTTSQLVVHERTHWPVKPYACSICGKGFKQIKALKRHSQKHTGETTFSCSHCGCAFCDLAALRVHQISKLCSRKQNLKGKNCDIEGFLVTYGVDGQVNTPVFFKCQICKQLYQAWCQYTLHLQTHTKSPPYLCFVCGQSYINNAEVKVHCGVCCQTSGEEAVCGSSIFELLHSDPKKCSNLKDNSQTDLYSMVAPKSIFLSSAGQIHKNSQTCNNVPTEYLAPKFPQFVTASHLPETVYLSNNNQSPTSSVISCALLNNSLDLGEGLNLLGFKCSRCGQGYKRYRNLCLHMRTHVPAFRYVCRHCGHSFKRWHKLWLHQRIHRRKDRCFTCSQCNLQFNVFSSYKMHLLNHAKEGPYICPLCLQTFACKESLHIHQCSFHQPTRKLQCDVCARSFSNLTNFIKHNLLHNGAKSHQCLPCNRSFANNKSLQKHLNTHNSTATLLPSIPSEPLTFLHKCNLCKSGFSNGDLLYAHQICHTRDLNCLVRSTKRSESTSVGLKGLQSTTRRSLLSTLDLDAVPKYNLFKYPHPDKLYLSPRPSSMLKSIPIINLDSGDDDIPQKASTNPVSPNSETGQKNSAHSQECTETEMPLQPPALEGQESIQSPNSEGIPVLHIDTVTDHFQDKASHGITQTIEFVETSVFLEGQTSTVNTADNEIQDETFKCADCSETLRSVKALYEHYFLHALGKKSL